jgi:AAA family ATP:ADP antiporter
MIDPPGSDGRLPAGGSLDGRHAGGIAATAFVRRLVECRPQEWRTAWTSFACNFLILSSYYIIRPIRDEVGVAGGVGNLPWLFTATLAAMLAANALFSALVGQLPRRQFIPIAYRFFIANLLLFFFLWKEADTGWHAWVGRAFYVWTSVFNLFVVSVFWALMSDTFDTEQAKRLFGFISVGGTLGAIVGAAVTSSLVRHLGTRELLLFSAALLELATWCIRHFPARAIGAAGTLSKTAERPIGGTLWSGILHELRSPYLLGISGYMLLYSVTSTVLYFQQAELAAHHFSTIATRTAFFAQLDLAVNVLTIIIQCFLTGRLLKWLGVGVTLALPSVISIAGFTTLGFLPVLRVFIIFQVLRRATNFAAARPAREVLFTVLSREDKYKAKSFLDTFIYRTGDQIGAWSYPLVGALGLGLAGSSFVAVPLAGGWLVLSLWLGRKQMALLRERERDVSARVPLHT